MACPSPYSIIEKLGPNRVKTWTPWCDWQTYLRSMNVSSDMKDYLRNFCDWDPTHVSIETCPAWGLYCDDPEYIFASQPLFTVCSMYPNMTRHIDAKQIMKVGNTISNATRNMTVPGPWEVALTQSTSSLVSTCMISWCALLPNCSSTQICATDSIYTIDGYLSTDGLGRCWEQICHSFRPVVNPDFGGFGVREMPTADEI